MNILYITVHSIHKSIDFTVRFYTYDRSTIIIKNSIHNIEQEYHDTISNIIEYIYNTLHNFNNMEEYTHIIVSPPCRTPLTIQLRNDDTLYNIKNIIDYINRTVQYNGIINIGHTMYRD